ncbi:MAG: hypothetical protein M9949_04930 [Candidatus Kapabacteria bacterium]|nr:hypothetical protein [Candidatus Kapabacteria bacterium]
MKELKKYLTEMIAEHEARCNEFDRAVSMCINLDGSILHPKAHDYWKGKLSEAQFTLEKLKDKLESINQTGESVKCIK